MAASVELEETTGRRRLEGIDLVINAPNRVRSLTVDLPAAVASDLVLWVHAVGPDGSSVTTPADVRIHDGAADQAFRMGGRANSTVVRGGGDVLAQLTISMTADPLPP